MDIAEIIRKEIRESGESRNQIGIKTHVDPASLCRFMQGGNLKIDSADRLLTYFGYTITKAKAKKRK